jgi:hypothetical protein
MIHVKTVPLIREKGIERRAVEGSGRCEFKYSIFDIFVNAAMHAHLAQQ